mmetsp:Transcript_30283/g.66603  ORF Transcript_30283/g.66603 Transcript_30283/m.66603 type:complete len:639 (+) Transcript_30283:237-2153(+)
MSAGRIKVYFALESNRRTKAFILVSGTATVNDAIGQLHDQKVVQEIWKEENVEFVGILPRSHLLDDDYRRDMATVPTCNPISECYVADDIILVRRSTYVDLCDISSDDEASEHPASDTQVEDDRGGMHPDDDVAAPSAAAALAQEKKSPPKRRGRPPKKKKKRTEKPTPNAKGGRAPNDLRSQFGQPLWGKTSFRKGSKPSAYQKRGKRISSEQGYSVYYSLTNETPQSIALKHNVPGGVERVIHDNRGLYNIGRSEKLSENTQLRAGAAIVLPPVDDDHAQEESSNFATTTRVYESGEATSASEMSPPSPTKTKKSMPGKSRDASYYQNRKKYGRPLSKTDLPPAGLPGYAPITQPEHGRRIYTCLDGDTPTAIASKFGYSDPEELVYHNRAIYSTRTATLEVDSPLTVESIFLLPLSRSDGQNDGQYSANDQEDVSYVGTAKSRPRKRAGNAEEDRSSGKKRKAMYMRERRRELGLYGKVVNSDGVPSYVEGSNHPPFDNGQPGSLILEADREDRRIYVCREGETATDIARRQRVYAPNPAGRVVFDNRGRHHGLKEFTKMKDGAIIVLPPPKNGPRHASAESTTSPQMVARRRPNRSSRTSADDTRHALASSASSDDVVVKTEHVKKEPDHQAFV